MRAAFDSIAPLPADIVVVTGIGTICPLAEQAVKARGAKRIVAGLDGDAQRRAF